MSGSGTRKKMWKEKKRLDECIDNSLIQSMADEAWKVSRLSEGWKGYITQDDRAIPIATDFIESTFLTAFSTPV